MHTLLNLKTSIPEFILITAGDVHDVNALDTIEIIKGSYYGMDKAYIDFKRLYRINIEKAFFVVRAKKNLDARVASSKVVNQSSGILSDQIIQISGPFTSRKYPGNLRLIKYWDEESDKTFTKRQKSGKNYPFTCSLETVL